jgi:hypothetical protein
MSAFGGKADIIQEKADFKKCPLLKKRGCAKYARSLVGALKALPRTTSFLTRRTPIRPHSSLAYKFFVCREEHIISSEIVLMSQKTKFE